MSSIARSLGIMLLAVCSAARREREANFGKGPDAPDEIHPKDETPARRDRDTNVATSNNDATAPGSTWPR